MKTTRRFSALGSQFSEQPRRGATDPANLLPGLKLRRTPRELLAADVAALAAELARIGGWATAAELLARLPAGWTDRRLRETASVEPAILSFPGSPGYRLTRGATPEEIARSIHTLHAQARRMVIRAQAYSTFYHRALQFPKTETEMGKVKGEKRELPSVFHPSPFTLHSSSKASA